MTFWPEKFWADVAHLEWDERLVYMGLLTHAWIRGGSLPNDDRQLRLLIGCSMRKWKAMRPAVLAFWTLAEDGRLHQKRLDQEWQRANKAHHQARQKTKNSDEILQEMSGKKPNDYYARARRRDPTPTPPSLNSYSIAGLEKGAAASLRVLDPHASRPLRLVTNTEPSPPPDDGPPAKFTDEQRARMAAAANRVIAEIAAAKLVALGEVPTGEVSAGTKAEIERKAAEEKLAALEAAADKPMLALSPTTRASRLLASAETA